MGRVQRSPLGILQLLGIKGVDALPDDFAKVVVPTLDVVQFYGNQQLQTLSASDAALAEGGLVSLTVPVDQWWCLFSVHGVIVKTATMTALRARTAIGQGTVTSEELGPFGATETGIITFGGALPYPRLIGPGTLVRVGLEILGTDATANVGVTAVLGVLG